MLDIYPKWSNFEKETICSEKAKLATLVCLCVCVCVVNDIVSHFWPWGQLCSVGLGFHLGLCLCRWQGNYIQFAPVRFCGPQFFKITPADDVENLWILICFSNWPKVNYNWRANEIYSYFPNTILIYVYTRWVWCLRLEIKR